MEWADTKNRSKVLTNRTEVSRRLVFAAFRKRGAGLLPVQGFVLILLKSSVSVQISIPRAAQKARVSGA